VGPGVSGPALVAAAAVYAAYAHRHQRRKTSGRPYIIHPARVALRLWRCGHRAPYVLAAALLHDVTEDTPHPVAYPTWPARVAYLVSACSERKRRTDGSVIPWLARKAGLLKACEQDADVAAIKAADLADNLSDCARYGWGGISVGPAEYRVYALGLLGLVDGKLARELRVACAGAGVSTT
jgi:(p)ppGpp synthase/HD superfamily hydrolase